MNVRDALPTALRPVAKGAYVSARRPTSHLRVLPDFLLIGGQRCGTTSLFRALNQHPQMVRPTFHKGINYFDINYRKSSAWYRAHFPTRRAVSKSVPSGKDPRIFEASGYYMFHPCAIERIASDLPDVRLVAMLRDPVERAYSAWKHERARGFEHEDFGTALTLEPSRVDGEADRMRRDPGYQSFAHRHHSYRARGEYTTLLSRALDRFPAEQLHVVYSESFFQDPETEFDHLCEFLGVNHQPGIQFDRHNARPSGSMPAAARAELRTHFSGQPDALERLVGRRPPWDGS